MRGIAALGVVAASLNVTPAYAQLGDGWGEPRQVDLHDTGWVKPKREPVAPWSTDFLDPGAYRRLGVTTRATFSDGERAFSSASAWAFEAAMQWRLAEGWALRGVVPAGLVTRDRLETQGFLGNVGLGLSYGATASSGEGAVVRWAVGLDATLPTASAPEAFEVATARSTVAVIRGRAPHLYIPRMSTFHARGHADATFGIWTFDLELGLAPAFTVGSDGVFVLLASASARAAARVSEAFEPYLEAGAMPQIAGEGAIRPPLWITPGIRLHIGETFDPALFVSFNFVESSAVVVGLDLTAVFRPEPATVDPDEPREFIDF